MSVSKYPAIAAEVLRRIRCGIYTDRIPPTRVLAVEFGTARQTVTNALRPLVAKGLLLSKPPQGLYPTALAKNAPVKRIVLVCRGSNEAVKRAEIFNKIRAFMAENGYEMDLRNYPKGMPLINPEKDFQGDIAGVIFMHSLLTLEVAEYLAAQNIPFISCNLMPVIPWLNYVEVDVFSVMQELADYLADKGYRRVSWFFSSPLESYNVFAQRSWRKICMQSDLERFPGSIKMGSSTPAKAGQAFAEYLLKLHRSRVKPEVVISSLNDASEVLRKIEQQHPGLLRGVIFVTFQSNKTEGLEHKVYRMAAFHNSYQQVAAAFEALQEKILAPGRQPIRRMIKYEFQMFDEIPVNQHTKQGD